ncbi:hypothetical protein [Nocardia sp. CDC160]|uniref:hypothetical protein n=1 Tax=Nocardia sp. CDC160 TaxID=3112166 RepID=UPI002DBC990F|nr:hypothetical protein [Nocardia sp. CDC160]MEC3919790.1 hypothetical protein [Nocardia sp. CDC160]
MRIAWLVGGVTLGIALFAPLAAGKNPDLPSTIETLSASAASAGVSVGGGMSAPTFGLPSWWEGGVCDPETNPGSVEIGRWGDLIACGPNNDVVSASDPHVGWGGALEWECVELSERYLNQRYHLPTVSVNGDALVDTYFDPVIQARLGFDMSQTPLIRVYPGRGRVPVPGDVLSFGQDAHPGHTGVVTASLVSADGNGVVTMINQNRYLGAPGSAFVVIRMVGGVPQPLGQLAVIDWIHDTTSDPR